MCFCALTWHAPRQVCAAADRLRAAECGDSVAYVVNRNINYTNVCTFKCTFCAFSKGPAEEALRGKPYVVPLEEVTRRTAEAWERGATEVCMQVTMTTSNNRRRGWHCLILSIEFSTRTVGLRFSPRRLALFACHCQPRCSCWCSRSPHWKAGVQR